MLALRKPSLVYNETPHSWKGPDVVVSGLLAVTHHWPPHEHARSPRQVDAKLQTTVADAGLLAVTDVMLRPRESGICDRVAVAEG